jgi:hypothetical protein
MKKIIILIFVCTSLIVMSLTPAQAQAGFNLDFTGGGDCSSWIDANGGGYLNATLSGGSDTIITTNNAGGAAPECNFASITAIYIELVGITADSISLLSAGNLEVTLYSGGPGGTVVHSSTPGAGVFSFSGASYDTIYLFSYTGTDVDNIVIGTPSSSSVSTDPRLNAGDYGAPVALYCTEGGGIDIYNIVGNEGVFAHRISDQEIANSIATAQESGNNVQLIGNENVEVWVLASGQIQINTGGRAYGFTYQGVCGALPEPNFDNEVEEEENVGVIINRPR